MAFWLKDYAGLLDRIKYEEFKLTDFQLSDEEKEEIQITLSQAYKRKKQFEEIVSHFKGIDHKILVGKYINGKTLETIAEELNFSFSYIYKKHAQIVKFIRFSELEEKL